MGNNNELALQHGGFCTTLSLVAKGLLSEYRFPLTPRGDRCVNSLYNFTIFYNISHTVIENEDYYQLKRCNLDMTPNLHDYKTKNSMVLVGKMNVLIVGMQVVSIIYHCRLLRLVQQLFLVSDIEPRT